MKKRRLERSPIKARPVFWKYLFSYICIAMIPMILCSVLSYCLIHDYLIVQMNENRSKSIRYANALLNQQVSALISISNAMSMERCFSPQEQSGTDMSRFYDITGYLMSNKVKTPFAFDMLYADLTQNSVYTPTGLYYQDDFAKNLYEYQNTDLFQRIEQLQPGQILLLPVESAAQYACSMEILTLVIPVSYRYQQHQPIVNGCAIFIIKKDTVDAYIQSTLESKGAMSVLYHDQTPVYCSETGWSGSLPEKDALSSQLSLGERLYDVFSEEPETGGVFSLSLIIPENELNTVRNIMLSSVGVVALLTVCLCSLMIVWFMTLNYRPLKNLSLFVKKHQPDELPHMNEVDTIHYVVSKLSEKQSELMANNEFLKRERYFYTLMDGSRALDERFCMECVQAGLPLEGPCYQILILDNEGGKNDAFKERFVPQSRIYWSSTIFSDRLIALMSGEREALAQDSSRIARWPSEKGIGPLCDTPEDLRRSLEEAQRQLRRSTRQWDLLPLSEIRSAHAALSNGSLKQFRFLSRSIADWAKQAPSSEAAAMASGLFIVGSLERIRSMDEPFTAISSLEKKYAVTPKEPMDAASFILGFADEIYKADKQKEKNAKASVQDVLEYIQNNCFHQSFSIKSMSEHFGVSSSNLSHYFKSRMGVPLLQYIQSVRMDKAKELLVSTSLPVSEIIGIIGYADTSSFIRRFKSETGVTPGEFRSGRQNKEK